MKEEVIGSKLIAVISVFFISFWSFGQVISSGEIIYEKRTNLEKRYEGTQRFGGNSNKWIKEPKIDKYVLYFNESASVFVPIPPDVGDEDREWSTMKNSTYRNYKENKMERQFSYYGSELYLRDSLKERDWIITENRREIAGFETKQALWIANDSTRIYAWYAERLTPSTGPESFGGLPGTILGLALEDGGVVYFAREVKTLSEDDIYKQMPKGKEKDYYNKDSLKEFVIELFSGRGAGGRIFDDIFVW
ncbi:hypothetical protein CW751_09360 [Brumimicrobium salinarum]|uniref:GLPGLI family protein n=1 Tax=Brumimicrobium salinarum TaxID=2058658 RepID=A0A2I0R1V6_9FLAO|nr:GLPGLI family protein [Brumimicrobium salinarum]PKR80571.1 hypothetical protein CW751_09360 [Brumimicrobium salinarum]